jgi:hypothetical protein
MADLQSCYFCASPDDVDEYAVVPPRLGGGDRSVALCPDCKTKLLGVMEPLIDRAEGSTDASAGAGGSTTEQSSTAPSAGTTTGSPEDAITMDSGSNGAASPTDTEGESESETGAGAAIQPTAGDDAPPQYRRAMRMLSNRPFPIELSEVESMLANAYDLEREEIDAVLDRAEAEGRLVAENGQVLEP